MDLSVAIVGSGFSGIGLAIRLRKAGRRGLRRARTRRRRRRHLALQHVSRLRLRRPVEPRTRSRSRPTRTGRAPTRDSPRSARTSSACRRSSACAPKIRLNCEVPQRRLGRRRAALAARHVARPRDRAKVLVSGTGPLVEPRIPDFPGLETFAGPTLHSARWDHSARPARASAWRRSAPAPRRSSTSRDRARRRAALRLPAHAAVGHAAQRAPGDAIRAARSTGAFPAAQRAVRGAIYAARELLVLGFVKQPQGDEAAGADRAPAPRARGCKTPS